MSFLTIAQAAEVALQMVTFAKELTFDTETSGVDWKRNSVVGYVIGAPSGDGKISDEDVHYIPIRHGGGGNLAGGKPLTSADEATTPHPFEIALAKAFEHRRAMGNAVTVGHNILFDCAFAAKHGIRLGRNLSCTQNNQAMLDEYQKSFSLKSCAEIHGAQLKRGAEMYSYIAKELSVPDEQGSMSHFWRLNGSDNTVVDYAVGDGTTTMQVYWSQLKQIQEQSLDVVYRLESELIWTVFRMKERGIRVDEKYLDELEEYVAVSVKDAQTRFPDGFNPRSPLDIKDLLIKNNATDWPTTAKGSPSFTEKWLKKYSIGRDIVSLRKLTNLTNSFIRPLREEHIYNGRVHATLNQLKADDSGTISGRFSCTNPNLQQLPKRDKDLAKRFRKAFVADEGCVFWERDYSQCEPRLFAHYSKDENLIDGYCSVPFVDVHTKVAELLNVESDPTAKRMNMGIFTGMQVNTFAEHMGWDRSTAAVKFNEWFEAFPGVKKFQNDAKQRLKDRGYVKTLLGRRCRLESPKFAYRGVSKIIQGSNADIIKQKLLDCDRMCEEAGDIVNVLMTVHDSFCGQYQDTPIGLQLFKELEDKMVDVQSPPFSLRVPFVMDGHEGNDWATATFGGA